jgi:hypothetical protein
LWLGVPLLFWNLDDRHWFTGRVLAVFSVQNSKIVYFPLILTFTGDQSSRPAHVWNQTEDLILVYGVHKLITALKMKALYMFNIFRFTTTSCERRIKTCSGSSRDFAEQDLNSESEDPRMQGPTCI